ncbi:AraC family transcriptional regulator [Herbiconiux sp. 11R-BC]|uniref:AraC family transcriptional regulator n=1 Tax=Herbiconiux sp. 11R-BC TaxID=3111637 RepID=UPI003C0A63F5
MLIRDGFPGQRLRVLSRPSVVEALAAPVTGRLLVTDAGHFPHAAEHGRSRPRGAAEVVVILCTGGAGRVELRSRRHEVRPGDVLVIPAGEPHRYWADPRDPWTIWWMHVAGSDAATFVTAITGAGAGAGPRTPGAGAGSRGSAGTVADLADLADLADAADLVDLADLAIVADLAATVDPADAADPADLADVAGLAALAAAADPADVAAASDSDAAAEFSPVIAAHDPYAARASLEHVLVSLERDETVASLRSASGAAWALLAQLSADRARGTQEAGDPILSAQDYLREHLDTTTSVAELAKMAGLSVSHFAARFRKASGMGVVEYHKRLRSARARELLITTEASVADIAHTVGYTDPFYFSRQFRAINGTSPTEYRAAFRGSGA